MLETREQIKEYLDSTIRLWRQKRDNPTEKDRDQQHDIMAKYYIDAYQSARMSIFDEILPKEDICKSV